MVEFDPDRRKTVSEPVPVLGLLAGGFRAGAMAFAERQTIALSSTGLLGFIQAPPALSHLVAVDETGRSRRLLPDAAVMESPRISPDGNRVAVAVSRPEGGGGGGRNVWILDVQRGTFTRITDEQDGTYPIWSPGGDRIAYSGGERGFDIVMRAADGTGSTTTMVDGDMFQFPAGFTRDEQWLVYRENHPETREDIRVIELATGTIRTLVGTYATELTFDRPGTWRLDIHVDDKAFAGDASLLLDVTERSGVADVGELAPFSNTKTLRSEDGDLSRITTSSRPDPELYRTTVAEALRRAKVQLLRQQEGHRFTYALPFFWAPFIAIGTP